MNVAPADGTPKWNLTKNFKEEKMTVFLVLALLMGTGLIGVVIAVVKANAMVYVGITGVMSAAMWMPYLMALIYYGTDKGKPMSGLYKKLAYIKATCQSLGDYCSNADLQQAQKRVSFDFREHLRKEKLIIENVEAELKDMKVIRRAEKAEGRVKRVLKEKLASIAVFEERVTVRLANRPPSELTNDTAANEIRHAIADLREDARDLDNELKRIQQDLAFLRKEKEETEEHIKDKRVAVKVDTKAFQIGEKKRSSPKKYQVTKKEEAEDTANKEKGKKKKNGKGRNIWAYYY